MENGFWPSKSRLTVLGIVFACFFTAGAVFCWYYVKYSRMIDVRLSGNVLQNTTQIFSAPEHISVGQAWGPDDLTTYLTRVGYRVQNDDGALGQFTARGNAVDIRPSKLSYFAGANPLAVQFALTTILPIRPISGGAELGTPAIEA